MSVHTPVYSSGIYYITFTCYNWLHLVALADGYDLVYKFFNVLKKSGHSVCGFCIMPNHLHMLLYFAGGKTSLNSVIGNGKRFLAYGIIQNLEKKGEYSVLQILKTSVRHKDRSKGQLHCVWKDSFDVKECRTEKFLLQKLNYIHDNPVRGKWCLALKASDYLHSSASFYLEGRQPPFPVIHYEKLIDWENMYPAAY